MTLLHTVLEMVFFVCAGPVLAIIAAVGLWQIKIAKDTSKMIAKREAYKIAAEQCSYYLSIVVPLCNAFDEAVKSKGVTFYENSSFEFDGDNIKVKFPDKVEYLNSAAVSNEFVDLANSLEAFAVPFATGLADEKVGFFSVGTSYCQVIGKLLPEVLSIGDGTSYYRSAVRLFVLWHNKTREMEIQEQKDALDKRMKSINKVSVFPIGTK